MKFLGKKVILIFFLFFFFSFFVVKAGTFDSFSKTINDFIVYIDKNITEQIRTDFCIQYFVSMSKGEWLDGEFRVKFGDKICKGDEEKYLSIINRNRVEIKDEKIPEIVRKDYVKIEDNQTGLLIKEDSGDNLILNDNQIIYWTNIERIKENDNLSQLVIDPKLTEIAKKRVLDMFENKYFEHISPKGDSVSKIADREYYKYIIIGENIALGNFGGSRDLVQSWMNSEGHRANILNRNYTNIGVYSKESEYNGRMVWISAQVFSKPMSYCVEPDIVKKQNIDEVNSSLEVLKIKIKNIELEIKDIGTGNMEKYNEKVTEYNTLAHSFNTLVSNIKKLTSLYNIEVQSFNECIKVN